MLTRVRSISQVLEPVRLRLSLDLLSRLRPSKNTRGPTASVVVDSVQACRPVFGGFGVLERCCGAPAATSRVGGDKCRLSVFCTIPRPFANRYFCAWVSGSARFSPGDPDKVLRQHPGLPLSCKDSYGAGNPGQSPDSHVGSADAESRRELLPWTIPSTQRGPTVPGNRCIPVTTSGQPKMKIKLKE